MLGSQELIAYRAEFNRLLGGSCAIKRIAPTADGMGGTTATWTEVDTVPCNVAPKSGPPGQAGGQVREVGARMVTLPAGTDVRTSDQLLIDGQTFEVVDLLEPRTTEFVRRVEARLA